MKFVSTKAKTKERFGFPKFPAVRLIWHFLFQVSFFVTNRFIFDGLISSNLVDAKRVARDLWHFFIVRVALSARLHLRQSASDALEESRNRAGRCPVLLLGACVDHRSYHSPVGRGQP